MPDIPPRNRREFLKIEAATTAAVVGPTMRTPAAPARDIPRFRTPLCDLLGIEYPILQSGMGGVAGAQLVSAAGGLGIVGATQMPPDGVRKAIREVRALTDRPFGVNLLLHSDMTPPADVSRIPEGVVKSVQAVLNGFRERLGLPASSAAPAPLPDFVPGAIEAILEERVPVFSIGLGNPSDDGRSRRGRYRDGCAAASSPESPARRSARLEPSHIGPSMVRSIWPASTARRS